MAPFLMFQEGHDRLVGLAAVDLDRHVITWHTAGSFQPVKKSIWAPILSQLRCHDRSRVRCQIAVDYAWRARWCRTTSLMMNVRNVSANSGSSRAFSARSRSREIWLAS